MKKIIVLLGLLLGGIAALGMGWDGRAPLANAQASMRIVDQNGRAVFNAIIDGGFANYRTPSVEQGTPFSAQTDTKGCAVVNGKTSGEFTYRVRKEGYYDSRGEYRHWMKLWKPADPNIQNGFWQPWNPMIEVKLKEIKNPIPMFVKSVRTDIPVENKPVGFDLEKGDWVSPYGAGVHGDVLFELYRDLNSWQDYNSSLTITFPNEKDGIQSVYASHKGGSKLVMPYSAPQGGYATNLFFEESYRNYQEEREDQNYAFRVRTVLDENGEIKSALYGKIHGAMLFDVRGSETASLLFKYYLNPAPNDRNVEFDPERNLFGGRDRFAP